MIRQSFIDTSKNAKGTASTSDVPSTKTFSNDTQIGVAGTAVDRRGSGVVLTPGTANQNIPGGLYGGVAGDGYVKGDGNLIPGNIRLNTIVFGTQGTLQPLELTAGDYVLIEAQPSLDDVQTVPTKYKEFLINASGVARVSFMMFANSASIAVYGQIYINGVAKGTLRTTNSTTGITYTEDISINKGDLLQIYCWAGGATRYYLQQTTVKSGTLIRTINL